jgi:hypothetical protein
MSASRFMDMPGGSPTLPHLTAGLKSTGRFLIAPAKIVTRIEDLRPDYSVAIEKTKLLFRRIEEIGNDPKNDVDAIVLAGKNKK